MTDSDGDAVFEARRHMYESKVASYVLSTIYGTAGVRESAPEAVSLASLWREIRETPELVE